MLTEKERIQFLIEEYRALYGLLSFRLAAVDRHLPVAGGVLGAMLGSFGALPPDTKVVILLGMPAALTWLMRSTINHSRSKEDVLRRIDEIERQVNQIAGEELLSFQSRHPNRGRNVSGRSGSSIVSAMLGFCLAALVICAYLIGQAGPAPGRLLETYWALLAITGLDIIWAFLRLRRYRYRKPPAEKCPLFIGQR